MYDYSDLLTKRYEPGGRGPDGFDCWGLSREVFRLAGKFLPEFHRWIAAVDRAAVVERIAQSHFIRLAEPRPIVLVGFRVPARIDPRRYDYHFGTVIEDCRQFIHARANAGIALSPIANYGDFVGFFDYVDFDRS